MALNIGLYYRAGRHAEVAKQSQETAAQLRLRLDAQAKFHLETVEALSERIKHDTARRQRRASQHHRVKETLTHDSDASDCLRSPLPDSLRHAHFSADVPDSGTGTAAPTLQD
ncbi:MAG: hypothetical protein Q4B94_00320 [Pseudomonadota bacterium]|nr:hypothetical protein [Pseudomonadota bacterium]